MKQIQVKILKNEEVKPGFFKMRIASTYLAKMAKPGQFVEVKCGEGTDPLLRRPIGVNRLIKGGIELLYEVIGRGTAVMSRMKSGGLLDVIGPLGNGFNIDAKAQKHKGTKAILVAGGNGVAPLLFLAEALMKGKREVYILIGGCSKSHILCEKDFKKTGAKVLVATEDGSKGHKGLVTHLLSELLQNTKDEIRPVLYACGPIGMLKAISRIAQENHALCQVSLEERMACGVGVCLGCPVKVRAAHSLQRTAETEHTYKMVCKDGPVFNAEEIVW